MDLAAGTTQFTILAFAGLLIVAAASDWRSLTVPNSYCLALVALFPSYAIAHGGDIDWLGHVTCAGVIFVAGFLMFTLRAFGGGDVKLFSAVSLWAGPELIEPTLLYTVLTGAVMAVALWIQYRFRRAGMPANLSYATSSAVSFSKQPIPYAVAIAAGGLYVALQLLSGV